MNRFFRSCLIGALLSVPAQGQRVEVQKPDRGQILHVRTALHHLTVLEMVEPVRAVAVGSPVFKVEWRENRVFVEPTEPNVATNLFVWTTSGRFNYELDPAGAVGEMHFAIDQPVADALRGQSVLAPRVAPHGLKAAQVLLDSKPVRTDSPGLGKKQIGVLLDETFQSNGQLFVRFTIRNESKQPYSPGTPWVVRVSPRHSRGSLYGISNWQLSDKDSSKLKTNGEFPLEVVQGEIGSTRVEPGQETVGIVGVRLPEPHEAPLVLRFVFPPGPAGRLSATLVL